MVCSTDLTKDTLISCQEEALPQEIPDYMYKYRFVTKNDDFGYPTHDKKIKAVSLIRNSVFNSVTI